MDKKYNALGREWLNPIESDDTGAISWSVEGDRLGVWGHLVLRDCSRQITLDFDFDERDTDREEQIFEKVEILLREIKEFKKNLKKAKTAHIKALKAYEKEKKNEGPQKSLRDIETLC